MGGEGGSGAGGRCGGSGSGGTQLCGEGGLMPGPYHEACQARMRRRFSHAGADPARREIRSSAQRKTLPPCAPVASRAFARDPQNRAGETFRRSMTEAPWRVSCSAPKGSPSRSQPTRGNPDDQRSFPPALCPRRLHLQGAGGANLLRPPLRERRGGEDARNRNASLRMRTPGMRRRHVDGNDFLTFACRKPRPFEAPTQ